MSGRSELNFKVFTWNPIIVSDSAALLDQLGRSEEAEALVFEATSEFESRNRELALFYCKLLESHSKRGSPKNFDVAYYYMNQLFHSSFSVYIKHRAFEYMVSGLYVMDRSREAEDLVEGLRGNGGAIDPSAFELKSIMYGYGRLGLFHDL
ncbi:hypothetical protein S83_052960 [Arachis hypogaea]|nr:Pentatricopeptide repeat-containing protein [Arachis hypogaea]